MSEKKKAMICQPMRGLTDEEILSKRNEAKSFLENLGYEVVNTFFDQSESEGIKNRPLYCLAKALSKMADCDTVYFCKGWEDTRGCVIEHNAAAEYGLNIIDEKVLEEFITPHPELDKAPVDDMIV